MKADEFFHQLWQRYISMAPRAELIRDHVEKEFGAVQNDHVAFRTFERPGLSLAELEPAFLDLGFERVAPYEFPEKHLSAWGYRHSSGTLPLVFLSQLKVGELSPDAQAVIEHLLDEVELEKDPTRLLLGGRPWAVPAYADYKLLEEESPYAAWLSVWGLCANHFTIAIHRLPRAKSLALVVDCLEQLGFAMNEVGGRIKGGPDALLEQASTLAEERPVEFAEGKRLVPSCYYEFARRYPQDSGELYQGFVAQSANNIFESTTARASSHGVTHAGGQE